MSDTVGVKVPTQAEQLRALVELWKRRWMDPRNAPVDAAGVLEQCILELEERL